MLILFENIENAITTYEFFFLILLVVIILLLLLVLVIVAAGNVIRQMNQSSGWKWLLF